MCLVQSLTETWDFINCLYRVAGKAIIILLYRTFGKLFQNVQYAHKKNAKRLNFMRNKVLRSKTESWAFPRPLGRACKIFAGSSEGACKSTEIPRLCIRKANAAAAGIGGRQQKFLLFLWNLYCPNPSKILTKNRVIRDFYKVFASLFLKSDRGLGQV
jgi:hypothetical protein